MNRVVIVTGSSRGIGAAIASTLSQTFPSNTHLVLMARNLDNLNAMKKDILERQPLNRVTVIAHDFARPCETGEFYKILKTIGSSEEELKKYSELYAIYNHGTLEFGQPTPYSQSNFREAYEINLFSVWCLLAAINLWVSRPLAPNNSYLTHEFLNLDFDCNRLQWNSFLNNFT